MILQKVCIDHLSLLNKMILCSCGPHIITPRAAKWPSGRTLDTCALRNLYLFSQSLRAEVKDHPQKKHKWGDKVVNPQFQQSVHKTHDVWILLSQNGKDVWRKFTTFPSESDFVHKSLQGKRRFPNPSCWLKQFVESRKKYSSIKPCLHTETPLPCSFKSLKSTSPWRGDG